MLRPLALPCAGALALSLIDYSVEVRLGGVIGRDCSCGSDTKNVDPASGPSDSAQARPSIASARARTMARPMPVPPSALERDGSTR